MANETEEKTIVKTPTWKFEWNLNTLVILFGFAGGLVAWGAVWERVNANQDSHANSIDRLDERITAVEVSIRQLDNHELRISGVEKQAAEAATSMERLRARSMPLLRTCALLAKSCSGSKPASATALNCGGKRQFDNGGGATWEASWRRHFLREEVALDIATAFNGPVRR